MSWCAGNYELFVPLEIRVEGTRFWLCKCHVRELMKRELRKFFLSGRDLKERNKMVKPVF